MIIEIIVPKVDISFITAGITPENTLLIYEITPGFAPKTFNPSRDFNLIDSLKRGKGYYIICLETLNLSEYIYTTEESFYLLSDEGFVCLDDDGNKILY